MAEAEERIREWNELFGDSDSELDEADFEGFPDQSDNDSDGSSKHDSSGSDWDTDDEEPLAGQVRHPRNVLNEVVAFDMDWLMDFTHEQGVLADFDEPTVCDIFLKLFPMEAINLCVVETNRYAKQYIDRIGKENLKRHSLAASWFDMNVTEMKAVIATILFMGYVRLPSYNDYWSTDPILEMKGFRSLLSRDRFFAIMQFFHICNNDDNLPRDHPDHDRLAKVRPLLNILVPAWQEVYYPRRELSIDESMIAYKGRTPGKMYKPNKPHKWGLNAWVLCEAKSGYAYNLDVYAGKKNGNPEKNMTYNVVTKLCEPIYNNGHIVFMDNFFSSPDLFAKLGDNQTGACGTLRTHRAGVPVRVKNAKLTKISHDTVIERDGNTLFISWFDKRQVNLITTVHSAAIFEKTVRCKDPQNNNKRRIQKPMAVELYTKSMGGVDRLDRDVWAYIMIHRTAKWWKKVFTYLLEVTFANCKTVVREMNPGQRISVSKIRFQLIHKLLENYERRTVKPGRVVANPPDRLSGRHFVGYQTNKTPNGKPSMPDCIVCSDRKSKRHQTEHICKQCNLPMHPLPCFERYHTIVNYKVLCTPDLHKHPAK